MEKLSSPTVIREIMNKYDFRFSKKLGQNFLIDENIINKIMNGAEITHEDNVLEIGPGIGAMTQLLAEKAKKVVAVEIDSKLIPILNDVLSQYENTKVIHSDILKLPLKEMIKDQFGESKIKVVANLPYYITTSIIMTFLENDLPVESITVMIQKEVAQRIQANPGGKDYGALSIAAQFYSDPVIVTDVPKTVFIPQPKVDSSVIKMLILDEPKVKVKDKKMFFKVVRAAFNMRRKTLSNALSNGLGINKEEINIILNRCNIDPIRRGETLSIEEFALLSENLIKDI